MSKRRRADHVNGCQASSDMAARRLPGIPLWSIWLLLPLVIGKYMMAAMAFGIVLPFISFFMIVFSLCTFDV